MFLYIMDYIGKLGVSMAKAKKFLSVGYGKVGQAIPERSSDLGLDHSPFIVKSDGTYLRQVDGSLVIYDKNPAFWNNEKVIGDVALVFMTIPSFWDGKRAFEVIKGLLARGIPIVTAEKGALANFNRQLKPDLSQIGIGATVGGGTRLLPILREHIGPRTTRIDAIINGTLNYVMDGLASGRTLGQMVSEGRLLGFAEPPKAGEPEPASETAGYLDTLNGELQDITFKQTILWNVVIADYLGTGSILTPRDFQQPSLTEKTIMQLKTEAEVRRHIVSIVKKGHETPEDDIIAGYRKEIDGWVIKGGFRRTDLNPIFKEYLRLPGPFNGAIIAGGPGESDGLYSVARGPGAGPGPTAASMVQDARQLLR